MDNFTLLATLFIITAVNTIFTFGTSQNAGTLVSKQWRRSVVLILVAFCLMLTQANFPRFVAIVVANYLLLIGFYYQIYAAFCFEFRGEDRSKKYLPYISVIYLVSFVYFTYVEFHTTARIVIISTMLAIFYGYAVYRFRRYWQDKLIAPRVKEIYHLFIISALFYVARVTVTIAEFGEVKSLFDRNTMTTISFLFLILFNLVFLMGMFKATIRDKNILIGNEKEKLNHLFDFLSDTAKHLKLDDLYPSIEKVLRRSFKVDTAAIFLKDKGGTTHSISYVFNDLGLPVDQVTTLNKGEGISGKAIEENKVITLDIETYPNKEVAKVYKAKGVTNMVSIPLKTAEGIIGAITVVYSTDLKKQPILDNDLFYYLGEQVGLVIQNALLYEKLSLLADTDPMTGILNRRKMQEMFTLELNRVKRNKESLTVAVIDLDKFKAVNDNFGHECGDKVIISSANAFAQECREIDHISRWGGEEFLCLFVDTNIDSAIEIAERLRSALEKQSYPCLNCTSVTASIGLAQYEEGDSMEQLIARADKALYKAKSSGRNRVEVSGKAKRII